MVFSPFVFVISITFEQRWQAGYNEHHRTAEVYFPIITGPRTDILLSGSNDTGKLPSQPRLAISVGANIVHYFEGMRLEWTLQSDKPKTFCYYGRRYFPHVSQSVLSILYVYTYNQEGSNWESSFFKPSSTFDTLVSYGRLQGSSVAEEGDADQAATTDHGPPLSGLPNFVADSWPTCGEEKIIIFTKNCKDKLEQALLRPGRNDFHVKMDDCTTEVSKLRPKSYLDDDNTSYIGRIQQIIDNTNMKFTPAAVAQHLMEDGLYVYVMNTRDRKKKKDMEKESLIEEEDEEGMEDESSDEEEKVCEIGESSGTGIVDYGFKKISETKREINKYCTREYWQIGETDLLIMYWFFLLGLAMMGMVIIIIMVTDELA